MSGDTFFEDIDLEDLTSTHLDTLIGRSENIRLEFKRTLSPGDQSNKELARDLVSFANSDGGYIVIGADEGKKDTCKSFREVDDPQGVCQRIRQVALDKIKERIIGISTKVLRHEKWGNIVVIHIPLSHLKPHMAFLSDKTEFLKRYETDKKAMTIEEIRDAFHCRDDVASLSRMEAKIDSISSQMQTKDIQSKQAVIAKDSSRLHDVTDLEVFKKSVDEIFMKEIQGKRYFRLTITPHQLNPNMVPTANPGLRGGEQVSLTVGLNFFDLNGSLTGQRVSLEIGIPIYQRLDGPQLETDWQANLGWQ